MKKILTAMMGLVLTCVLVVSLTACNIGDPVKVIEIDLTEEEYAFILPKNSPYLKQINGFIADLKSEKGLGEDGVTIDDLFEAEVNDTAEPLKGEVLTSLPAGATRSEYFVVATNAEFAPFEYFMGDYYAGIDMQIAQLFAKLLNKKLVIVHMEFDAVIPSVSGGAYTDSSDEDAEAVEPKTDADIGMAGLTVTPKRAEVVQFTDSYYNAAQRVAVLKSDKTFDNCTTKADVVAALKTLNGKVAGAAQGQTGLTYLEGDKSGTMGEDFAGFADVFSEIKAYSSIGNAVQDLSLGKLKVVVGDKFTLAEAVNGINKK